MSQSPTDEDSPPAPVRNNRRAKSFRFLFDELPDDVKELARKKFLLFLRDPSNKSLRLHQLKDTKRGRHESGSFSVSIDMQYRAIFFVAGDTNVWYWVGTHAQYNHFTGKN